jgi:catalase
MFIPLNNAAYSPNTLNNGFPAQANQTSNRGFFTAPNRSTSGKLVRSVSSTFADVWSQPRLFFNSLLPAEQQFVVNAIRFEMSNLKSSVVKNNALIQLNRISNDVATRVAKALGMEAPAPDPTFYHNNKTIGVSVFENKLAKLDGLKVGYLTTLNGSAQDSNLQALIAALSKLNVDVVVVAESLAPGVNQTYSAAVATNFDAVVVSEAASSLFNPSQNTRLSTLYPAGRPAQILTDAFRFGKPVGSLGSARSALQSGGISGTAPGVYTSRNAAELAKQLEDGLRTFKFLDRFPLDQ